LYLFIIHNFFSSTITDQEKYEKFKLHCEAAKNNELKQKRAEDARERYKQKKLNQKL